MLIIKVLILATLLFVFVQDILSRAVYWLLFPLLIILFIITRIVDHEYFNMMWPVVLINVSFLLVQLVGVTAWFSFKQKRWVNITAQLLGWGDLLFLLSLTFYLSVLNFLFFYVISLILVLGGWLIWQTLVKKKDKHIPLAGLQAMCLVFLLSSDWWLLHLNVTGDGWLLKLLIK